MPVRVLMVCLGNICRSPLAEGILSSKVNPSEITVDSAGTAGYHVGNPPDPRSIETAALQNIDISRQKCRRFSQADFDNFDYIFAMDRENLMHLQDMARNESELKKLHLLLELAEMPEQEVPDPYYGGDSGFQEVFRLLDRATDQILPILSRH
ncbi:low molecular weight protein-tyrosine-phosphatase [Robiginitalea aurantiaca]|uniref:protein-tyrosine-phosphatase n=1 Tax=Robiginitalea aurantiaca TaxID=3056915 RepID=A0ABT7WGB5_9FLAO|nr:low molecular weight protein-tyrosine-phosphatase [Robiginitalea aurantiaca]MDM9631964.1 low molecular weight protein-tyrosine-phosphatase [Robiginitalea aurantiaca]